MATNAVLQGTKKYRAGGLLVALLAGAALLFALSVESAAAASVVGKDGTVQACYRVKGKPKGAVRLVGAKQHCRRGERRVKWSVSGPQGPQGAPGQPGATGSAGAAGPAGAAGASGTAGLEGQVKTLTSKIDVLEKTLNGVNNESLTKALSTVNGLTNSDLTGALSKLEGVSGGQLEETVSKLEGVTGGQLEETVESLADVDALCTQATALTSQVDALGTSLTGLSLNGALTALGGVINVPGVPTALPAFTCP